MAVGVVHGASNIISIIRQEKYKNAKNYNIIFTEYSNGYVTIDAHGYENVYAAGSQVTSVFDFPTGIKIKDYNVYLSFGSNGFLINNSCVKADAMGNSKYNEYGFNYTWQQRAKYNVEFMFHIVGFITQ